MSWRLIFAILLLSAGAAAWGGLQLGDWLVAHGPTLVQSPVAPSVADPVPVLGADGKPYVATAPQPLSDGRQGVPEMQPPVDWSLHAVSLMDDEMPRIALATTTITLDEAIALASQNQMDNLQGIANIAGLEPGHEIQPIDVSPQAPAPAATSGTSWQAEFQAELRACESLGFFSRPSCAWAARNKYCEPHQAWGQVSGCPSKKSSF